MSYRKGRSFEYSVRNILMKSGFDVTRSAGSRGIKDLVAVKNGRVYYIQCKYNMSDVSHFVSRYKNDIISICKKYKVVFVFACRPQPRKHIIKFLVANVNLDESNKINVLEDFSNLSVEFLEV